MTVTATRPAAPVTPAPATTASPSPARPDDAREEARRALQASLDTRQ
ncbi:hypothetical protein [Catenuloplanes japonicus]|nr:hypothetical protein [Catenuloplanes japonicus]